MDLKLFGSGMDVKPGTPPVSARSTTPTSSPYRYPFCAEIEVFLTLVISFVLPDPAVCRANSTSPSSQTSKMNSMLYQKQFQPNSAGMRMAQHFPGQFNPQVLGRFNDTHNASRHRPSKAKQLLIPDSVSAQHRLSSGPTSSCQLFCWRRAALSHGPSDVTKCGWWSHASSSTSARPAQSAPTQRVRRALPRTPWHTGSPES